MFSCGRPRLAFLSAEGYNNQAMQVEILIENVRVSRGGQLLLDSVSWHLPSGGRVALLGGNGAGKSTLLRLARGDIWPDQLPGGQFAGLRQYVVDGHSSDSPIAARPLIGLAGADLRDLYRRRGWPVSAWLIVVSGLTDSPLPSGAVGQAQRQAALEALDRVGAADLAYRPLTELSQGQVMAVLLARAMVKKPAWLFLDEALDGLDVPSRRRLGAVLVRLAGEGVGLAAATHHPASLPDMDFATTVLAAGRVRYTGSLTEAARRMAPARRTSVAPAVPDALGVSSQPPLLRMHSAGLILAGRDVLVDVSWALQPGENWVVLGLNGAGKSSFLKLLAGELHVTSGSVCRFGLPEPASLWDVRARLGYTAWDIQAEYPQDVTVRSALLSGFFGSFGLYDQPSASQQAAVEALLARLGLIGLADAPLGTLSQGQGRKVIIGRALVHGPQVLLLDEPLGGLDQAARGDVLALLDDLAAQGCQLVTVTHNPQEIPWSTTHALVLDNGRVTACGPAGDVLAGFAP